MMWSIDFMRAFMDRPRVVRWLIRILLGRYARNELSGLKVGLEKAGHGFYWIDYKNQGCYDLEDMGYHKEYDKYKDW